MTLLWSSADEQPTDTDTDEVGKMVKGRAECSVLNLSWPKKRGLVAHSKLRRGPKDIQCLPDELLADILYRQNSGKSIIQCKVVCKRWRALISQPQFIPELYKRNLIPSPHFLFPVNPKLRASKDSILYKKDLLFSLENCTLSYIYDDQDDCNGSVVGASHDLVLYHRDNKLGRCHEFYIRNIQTKQRIQLPSSPFYYACSNVVGFVCDPPDYGNNNWICKYSVAVINTMHPLHIEFPVNYLLSTNGNKWCQKFISLPEPWPLLRPLFTGLLTTFKGKHFFCSLEAALLVDPYPAADTGVIECRVISWPPAFRIESHRMGVGVCNGNLLFSSVSLKTSRIWVWILKTSKWCLLHNVAKQDLVSVDPLLKRRDFKQRSIFGFVLIFNPTNSNVIYTVGKKGILLWDLRNRTLELISPIAKHRKDIEYGVLKACSVSLPWLPTPLITP